MRNALNDYLAHQLNLKFLNMNPAVTTELSKLKDIHYVPIPADITNSRPTNYRLLDTVSVIKMKIRVFLDLETQEFNTN